MVIKYVPHVGDSKRAMDEYTSEIAMGGHNTLVVHNTCEDSLLAAPIILDLAVLAELFQRITFKVMLLLLDRMPCTVGIVSGFLRVALASTHWAAWLVNQCKSQKTVDKTSCTRKFVT